VILLFGLVQVGFAQQNWLARQKKPSAEGQWVLLEDGSVTRGDPKTTYDQSENRLHSEKQRERSQPTLDLTGRPICAQGGSNNTDNFFVNFGTGRCGFGYDAHVGAGNAYVTALVYYDLRAYGEPIKAYQRSSYQIKNKAEVEQLIQQEGLRFRTSWQNPSGGVSKQYRGESQYQSLNYSEANVHYTASGEFWQANVDIVKKISLDQVKVANYYDLPMPSCLTLYCSGFDENGNLQKEVTITYDGKVLR